MTDTRPRAEQKAREKHTGSARQQAKEALREEISTFNGAGVKKIASAAESRAGDDNRRLRVVAYCRVSTDDLDQTISIELQKDEYKRKIKANPQWIYGGTYADDGFSGTNTEHRPAFRLMMEDALAGRFDMIITKSVSRFARNLVDCIQWVRKLQDLNPPIKVFFEQENIDTLQSTSNIILFVLAMVAEEESHMKSEAMLLSLEWRFSRGRFLTPALLGYDKVIEDRPDGYRVRKLVINEPEADTVRLMYYMLLNGSSTSEIAQTLIDLQRPTRHFQKDEEVTWNWTPGRVVSVLRNERYCGDVLARETWTPNFHDHKSKRNVNEKNKYFQPDHHEAIVTRAVWNAAQRILNSNRYRGAGSYEDGVAGMLKLPLLLKSPETIVAVALWLNHIVEGRALNESPTEAVALSASKTSMALAEDTDAYEGLSFEALADAYEYAYWLGYIYRFECLLHEESSRMVYGAFSEVFMRETWSAMAALLRDVAQRDTADRICRKLDELLVGKLWPTLRLPQAASLAMGTTA